MINYLKKEQPILFQTLKNTKANNTFPQAILLSGSFGLPLLEIAKFVASTIICKDELACLNCLDCFRIENQSYTDLVIIDGKMDAIKKPNIQLLQDQFSKSALEVAGKKIYIINHIENSTKQAINSLLKFLEEPDNSLFAILTTANINDVLPTIISRCLTIRLKTISKSILIKQSIEKEIPYEDSLIISSFITNIDDILKTYSNEQYLKIKNSLLKMIEKFNNKEDFLYFVETYISDIINTKIDFELLLDILTVMYNDVLNFKNNKELSFIENKDLISKLSIITKDIEKSLEIILLTKGRLSYNVNIKLLLDNLFIRLGDDINE